ncbi:FmdB family zinc ribbon protein [Leptothoe kymatousa]|uniref:Zinc ribbon domain-containing protein n=1 Tax=Leptothoe kymatousa TAU-MAC 1615 TaxID=2364775 RepID=A0ABS5Y311_9CYAN|nr:zinc ribbon domain-containing protein [Leptothoe kymatousa TAU-MAC 1615]
MPLYDYTCSDCGDFEVWRKMAEVSNPMPCPKCDTVAKRIFTAPNISLNSASLTSRIKGSSEPRLVQRRQDAAPSPRKNQTVPGGRPWMLGHAQERL